MATKMDKVQCGRKEGMKWHNPTDVGREEQKVNPSINGKEWLYILGSGGGQWYRGCRYKVRDDLGASPVANEQDDFYLYGLPEQTEQDQSQEQGGKHGSRLCRSWQGKY